MRQKLVLLLGYWWMFAVSNARIQYRVPLSNSSSLNTAALGTGSSTPTAKNSTLAWQTAGVAPIIPNVINLDCTNWNWTSEARDASPCYAVCAKHDKVCLEAARAEAKTCSSQWAAYESSSSSWASKYRPGSRVTSYTDYDSQVYSIFSSLSTDTDYTVTGYNGETYNPVYAFGSAKLSTSPESWVNTWTVPNAIVEQWITVTETITTRFSTSTAVGYQLAEDTTGFPLPTPYCSITSAMALSCEQCTIAGGDVQMYYWPVAESSSNNSASAGIPRPFNSTNGSQLVTAVVDGMTMTSPSVYISVQTLYAKDLCGTVGGTYSGEILTMRPEDVSTVFGVEGPGYRPHNASRINFADLEGAVPASAYEMNNACARFGCPTIYNDYYRPTLAIPPKVRSMDPAWAACGLDFEGLYDPPIALTPTAGVVVPTDPAGGSSAQQSNPPNADSPTSSVVLPTNPAESSSTQQSNSAVPCSTPSHSQAPPTALPESTSSQNQEQPPSTDPDPVASQPTSTAADDTPSPPQGEPSASSYDPAPTASASNAAGVFSTILDPSTSDVQISAQSQAPGSQIGGSSPPANPPATSSSQNVGGIIASVIGALPTSNNADPQSTAGSNDPTTAPAPNGQFSVAPGVTLSPGSATTISGTTFSAAQSGSFVIVNGATSALPPVVAATAPPLLTIGSQVFTPTSSEYVIAGQTLTLGSSITVSGTTISLASSGGVAVVNGATQTLATSAPAAVPVLTLGTESLTANSQGVYVIAGQTLSPGSVITVSGTTISLASSGGIAVMNGATETLAPTASTVLPVLTVGTDSITANPQGVYTIDGQTLSPGSSITVSGTIISFASSGGVAVVNGVTQTLAPSAPAVLTVGSESITANSLGDYVIDGQTLSPGGTVTVGSGSSMTTLSMLITDGQTEVVFGGTSTQVLHGSQISGASITHTTGPTAGATGTGAGASQATSTGGSSASGRTVRCWSYLLVVLSLGFIWP